MASPVAVAVTITMMVACTSFMGAAVVTVAVESTVQTSMRGGMGGNGYGNHDTPLNWSGASRWSSGYHGSGYHGSGYHGSGYRGSGYHVSGSGGSSLKPIFKLYGILGFI